MNSTSGNGKPLLSDPTTKRSLVCPEIVNLQDHTIISPVIINVEDTNEEDHHHQKKAILSSPPSVISTSPLSSSSSTSSTSTASLASSTPTQTPTPTIPSSTTSNKRKREESNQEEEEEEGNLSLEEDDEEEKATIKQPSKKRTKVSNKVPTTVITKVNFITKQKEISTTASKKMEEAILDFKASLKNFVREEGDNPKKLKFAALFLDALMSTM
jgi:hypothetical protein